MEDCFEFDLRFLGQSQGEIVESSNADRNYRELARRIAETNNLVHIANSLRNENEGLKKQLLDLTGSANEVQDMYQKEKLHANELSIASEKYLKRAEEAEKESLSLRAELVQKTLYYFQLEEEWKQSIEKEKMRRNTFSLQNSESNVKCHHCKYLGGKSAPDADSPNKSNDLKSCVRQNSELLPLNTTKRRDSNRVSRMVSRGTQYQSSTTTRSTCTSAFIKKHSVAVNFPEVVPIAIEDIFTEVLVDIPNLLSPIQEICEIRCDVAVQTEEVLKSSTSVSTCTDLYNVRNELELKPSASLRGSNKKSDLHSENSCEKIQPQLSELWELLGQTIFALIGTSNENGSNNEDVGCRIEMLKRRFGESYGSIPYYNSIELPNFSVGSIPKKEINQSSCSSPDLKNIDSSQNDVNIKSKLVDLPHIYYSTGKMEIPHSSRGFNGIDDTKFVDQIECQEEPLNNAGIVASDSIVSFENDTELAAVNNEVEMLERKMLLISPIRDRGNIQESDKINRRTINIVKENSTKTTSAYLFEDKNKEFKAMKAPMKNLTKLHKRRKKHLKRRSSKIKKLFSKPQSEISESIRRTTAHQLTGRPSLTSLYNQKNKFKTLEHVENTIEKDSNADNLSDDTNISNELHRHIAENSVLETEDLPKNFGDFEMDHNALSLSTFQKDIANSERECLLFRPGFSCNSAQSKYIPNMKIARGATSIDYNSDDDVSIEPMSEEEDFYGFASDNIPRTNEKKEIAHQYCDAPTSPEAIDQTFSLFSLKTIPLERSENDSDYSPASPVVTNVDPLHNPKEIPLNRIGFENNKNAQSVLSRFISKYNISTHRLCVRKNIVEAPKDGRLLWLLRKIIERYLICADEKEQCLKCAKRILRRTKDVQIICAAICEVIEDTNERISNEFTPPATVMTKSHLKIMLLINSLKTYLSVIECKLIFILDQRIFNLKPDSMKHKPLINLFLLYLGLIDVQKSNTNPARFIIYKSLYYYKKLSFPMVYYILVSYPNVLPAKDEIYYEDPDPLVDTIQSILNSQQYNMENTELKHREVFHILRLFYKYERVKPSREEVVDVDEQLLLTYSVRAQPLVSDYLNRRKKPLRVDIYKGSIDSSVDCLLGVDAVIGIEIIEHLYPDVLDNVPFNVFGYIRPKLVIFSTPNSEYNSMFKLTLPNGFRHEDHKFEWTREEFKDWCFNICTRFPNYQVAFLGVGDPPSTNEKIGHVTQIGVFIRNDVRNLILKEDIQSIPTELIKSEAYKLLYSVEFPIQNDERTFDEKLLDEVKYHIYRHINMKNRYFNEEFERFEIPIENILEFVYPMVATSDELRCFLANNQYEVDVNNRVLVDNTNSQEDDDICSSTSNESNEVIPERLTTVVDSNESWD